MVRVIYLFWLGVLYISGIFFSCIYGHQFVEESWKETSEKSSLWDPFIINFLTLTLALIWPYWLYMYLKRGHHARS